MNRAEPCIHNRVTLADHFVVYAGGAGLAFVVWSFFAVLFGWKP